MAGEAVTLEQRIKDRARDHMLREHFDRFVGGDAIVRTLCGWNPRIRSGGSSARA